MNALERLRRGEVVYGMFQTYPDPELAELIAWCGYDFLVVDSEHGALNETAQIGVIRAASASGAFTLVRTRPGDESAVARYLDFGAEGLLIPDLRSAEQAREIAFVAQNRWAHGLRFDRYGQGPKPQPFIAVLIESPEAVDAIEDIAAIEGIDAVMIGPGDLSLRMGTPGAWDGANYLAAVDRVEAATCKAAKILGGKPYAQFTLPVLLERGHTLLTVDRDTAVYTRGLKAALVAAKADAEKAKR